MLDLEVVSVTFIHMTPSAAREVRKSAYEEKEMALVNDQLVSSSGVPSKTGRI